jgi:hypothetical protein
VAEFCRQPGCMGIAQTGKFCELHKANNYQTAKNRFRKEPWYGLAAWEGPYGVRLYKLRHFPICERAGCGKPSCDVHHKDDSWKRTRDWRKFIDQTNLEALCRQHHSEETMKRNRERGLLCTNGQ